MDIAVGSVAHVVDLALKIKEAVDTVRQNREDCVKIGIRVTRLRAILLKLGKSEMTIDPAMNDTLKDLEETLSRALELVTACQKKNIMRHFFTAGNLSKELREVNQDIMEYMAIANFGNNVQNTITFIAQFQDENNQKKLMKVQSINGEEEIYLVDSRKVLQELNKVGEENSRSSQTTDDTRSEVNDEIRIVPARREDGVDPLSRFTAFRLSMLETATNNFSGKNVIGRGASATVYKGVMPDGLVVAIKKMFVTIPQQHAQLLANYVELFSVLDEHENVVRLLGYCLESRSQIMWFKGHCILAEAIDALLVEEYMPMGSWSWSLSQQLNWSDTSRIIRGVARGVAYLHSKRVIHLDLKPENILLDSDMNPKICDFEVSKVLDAEDTEEVSREFVGTPGYFPPEYITDGIISVKSDVFSFGVILLRTISQMSRLGLARSPIEWAEEVLEAGRMNEVFNPSLCNESQLNEIKRCMEIGLLCIQGDRKERPTMPEVVEMLDSQEKLPTPKHKVPRATSLKEKRNKDRA